MSLLDLFKGPQKDNLAEFNEDEAESLALHVRLCAARYGSLAGKQGRTNSLLIVLIIVLVLTRVIDVPEAIASIVGR